MQIVRLSQAFQAGSIVETVMKPQEDAVLLTSDSKSYILSVDYSAKSGHFKDLIVVPMRQRAQQLLLLDAATDDSPKRNGLMVGETSDGAL